MREIARTFMNLETRDEGGLIAYVTAGDPEPCYTPEIVKALINGGADIVELGIPFSDPIADGPIIQASAARALKAGTTPKKVLKMAQEINERTNVPLVILTYFNPIFKMGVNAFFESAEASGIDGVIVPDLSVEEAGEYKKIAEIHNVDTVFLASPSTSAERMQEILEYTSGFLYLVSVFGVTGTRERINCATIDLIKNATQIVHGRVPLAVGFGVSKPEHVNQLMKNGADAAIIGSAFVRIIERERNRRDEMLRALETLTSKLKTASKKLKTIDDA